MGYRCGYFNLFNTSTEAKHLSAAFKGLTVMVTKSHHRVTTMNAKRVLPLALLHAAGGQIKGKTRFQKLAFISEQRLEEEGISPLDFIPYDYGPFSKELYEALDFLEDEGLVEVKEKPTYGGDVRYDYHLTRYGRRRSNENFPDLDENQDGDTEFIGLNNSRTNDEQERLETLYKIADDVVSEYNDMPISNLIKEVYDEYPQYAENSVLN